MVQGGGFRPFVYRLATSLELGGHVLNDPRGVPIEAGGDPPAVERFLRGLEEEAPPLGAAVTAARSARPPSS